MILASDCVGNLIKNGDKCMHVRKSGNTPIFKEVEVVDIKSQIKIGIRTGNNTILGWTRGSKLIKIIKE